MAKKKTKKAKGSAKKRASKAKAAKKAKTKAAKTKPAANTAKKKATANTAKPKRLSALDAAATVLKKSGKPMRSHELITAMDEQGLWTSPGGKTPHATLYAAIIREIAAKSKDARVTKTERGLFAFAG